MINLYYTIPTKHENDFDEARFNLMWRFNYVLSALFLVLNALYLIQGNTQSLLLFIFALCITGGSLVYLYRTHHFKAIYFFISIMGVILPSLSFNIAHHEVHYGNIVWIIVAVCLAYFGLGSRIGFFFALAGLAGTGVHIIYYLNQNLAEIKPLDTIAKCVLITELSIAFSLVFYIINQYTRLNTLTELRVLATNKELESQNKTIFKQNKEKEVLLKEIHHRVKNNLQIISSLLNLQSHSIANADAFWAIKEGQSRIKTMALLHQRLYQNSEDLSRLNFSDYVRELTTSIHQTYGTKIRSIKTIINIENRLFDIDTAIPLGLIINELTSNAYKYALEENGTLSISILEISKGHYQLEVRDSGKGMPIGFDIEKTNSLGLKLVRILSKQLGGEMKCEFDNGAKFIISFCDSLTRTETL